ncbi:MAG: FtsX-like permease family protein [Rhodospirillaceae bacterium]
MALTGQLFRLVLSDLRRDWLLVICQVFALAAVLMPLMVLHGLRHGILDRLVHDMATIPAMREIAPVYHAARRYDEAWFAAARARPDVAFAVGNILSIAAELPVHAQAGAERPVRAMLAATGPGDPLADDPVRGWAVSERRVVLSTRAATELGVAVGQEIQLEIPRFRGEVDESRRLAVTVAAIVPPDRLSETRSLIYVPEALAFAVERYRNGYAVPERGWTGAPPPAGPMAFARFRLYARSLDDVAAVAAWLRDQGITVDSRQEDIAPVLGLNRALGTILQVISLFAVFGFLVALAAIQWSETERKARDLALLSLIGYGPGFLVAMRLLGGLIVVGLGVGLGSAAFTGVAAIINALFPHTGSLAAGPVCTLPAAGFGLIALGALVISVISSGIAALRVLSLDTALVIRG